MVRVNIDENQQIAQQMRVQSVPTVYGFVDGKPVDGFAGAQPESTVRQFVDKIAGMGGAGPTRRRCSRRRKRRLQAVTTKPQ